jgi:hypothetical protein
MPKTETMNGSTDHLYEIEGCVTGTDTWHGLFQYTPDEAAKARAVLTHILSLEELPKEVAMYEDFRLRTPTVVLSEATRRLSPVTTGKKRRNGAGKPSEEPTEVCGALNKKTGDRCGLPPHGKDIKHRSF